MELTLVHPSLPGIDENENEICIPYDLEKDPYQRDPLNSIVRSNIEWGNYFNWENMSSFVPSYDPAYKNKVTFKELWNKLSSEEKEKNRMLKDIEVTKILNSTVSNTKPIIKENYFRFYIDEYKGDISRLVDGTILKLKLNEKKGILKLKFTTDQIIQNPISNNFIKNWFTSKIVISKTPSNEEYEIKIRSKVNFILYRIYYNIYNSIKYNIIWLLQYNKKLRNMIKEFRFNIFTPFFKMGKFFYVQFHIAPSYKGKKIKKQSMAEYTLIHCEIPDVVLEVAIDKKGIGGIKLIYSISKEEGKEYPLTKREERKIIFLKPLKENYAKDKKSCPKGTYGNKSSPFANIWLEVPNYTNYKNEIEDIIPFSKVVTNHQLIKNLNTRSEKFTLGINPTLTLKNKIIITLKLIWFKIIDRILINNKPK